MGVSRYYMLYVRYTAARVRGEWRHAVAMSNVDIEPLSDYEQPLPICERGGGPVVPATRRHERHGRGDAGAPGLASRCRNVERRHGAAIGIRTTATNPQTWRRACRASDTPTRTSRARRRGARGIATRRHEVTHFRKMCTFRFAYWIF